MRATRALIHLDNFNNNVIEIQKRIGSGVRLCASLKADAYGHGAIEIASAGLKAGISCLGVASVQEGEILRKSGITAPILLFSQTLPEEIPEIIENKLCPLVSDCEFIKMLDEAASAAGIRLPVHLKIDTGMGRMGCSVQETPVLAHMIASSAALDYAGTATHLAVSDSADPGDIMFTRHQIAVFTGALDSIRAAGINPGIIHAGNSGAVILHPEAWFDMVRPGILLYGYKTTEETADLALPPLQVKPVMELRSNVVLIKQILKGTPVSYGRTWVAEHDTAIGILPVGYADGLPRLAGSSWQAVINGRSYPLAGRICMDQCMVDLGPNNGTGQNVRRWDEAVLFGGPAPGADSLAALTGTIPYEITCNINKRVPRVYVTG